MYMQWGRIAGSTAAAFFILTACSSQPSGADARGAVEKLIQSEVGESAHALVSFEKIDGQSADVSGVQIYKYFYRAKVSFPNGLSPECLAKEGAFPGLNCAMRFGIGKTFKPQPKRAEVTYEGEIDFQATENRWLTSNVSARQVDRKVNPLIEKLPSGIVLRTDADGFGRFLDDQDVVFLNYTVFAGNENGKVIEDRSSGQPTIMPVDDSLFAEAASKMQDGGEYLVTWPSGTHNLPHLYVNGFTPQDALVMQLKIVNVVPGGKERLWDIIAGQGR
jgi:hypothetical protein